MDAIAAPKPKVLFETDPFIPYLREQDFDTRLKPVVEPYKKRMGFLPNALKLYAYRPEIAETLWKLNSNIMRDPSSTLDQLFKRKLAAVACATNGCAYCTAHSCAMLKKSKDLGFEGWGLSEEELQDIITGAYEPKNVSLIARISALTRSILSRPAGASVSSTPRRSCGLGRLSSSPSRAILPVSEAMKALDTCRAWATVPTLTPRSP